MEVYVCILIFFVKIWNINGEAYNFTISNYTWLEAKNQTGCSMIGRQKFVNISMNSTKKFWTDATVTYSAWLDYLGCYNLGQSASKEFYVTDGQQLLQCLKLCIDFTLIGLQNSKCICFRNTSIENDKDSRCDDKNVLCTNDDSVFCEPDNNESMFVLYRKVDPSATDTVTGDCLTVTRNQKKRIYRASSCSRQNIFRICYNGQVSIYESMGSNWSEAFDLCPSSSRLATFTDVNAEMMSVSLQNSAYYWLATIRKPIFSYHPSFTHRRINCVAAIISETGKVNRVIENCNTQLPIACLQKGSVKDGGVYTDVLVVAVIISAVLVLIVIVSALLIIRRKGGRCGQFLLRTKNIAVYNYAEFNEPIKSQAQSANLSIEPSMPVQYDHVNFVYSGSRCTNEETPEKRTNMYDTMQNIENGLENNYNHTNEIQANRNFLATETDAYTVIKAEVRY